ncbi:hypothetical protein HAX54_011262 [Datura stramonium]|uniref:Uncharacterized protein n=1 Tax=Datura stramonium TaxID=4076 RepID=A0ABS8THL3_DATST|nr:hypothetical protein [Datura stramonium]
MNAAADVGCETSSGTKELVDKDDNDVIHKQRSKTSIVALGSSLTLEDHPSDMSLSASDTIHMKKKAKNLLNRKGTQSLAIQKNRGHENDVTQKQRSKTFKVALGSSLTLEDHPSDEKHEADLQSNDVSSIPSTKNAKRTSSIKKEPGVSSSKRSKRNPQKSDIGSMYAKQGDENSIWNSLAQRINGNCEALAEAEEVTDRRVRNLCKKKKRQKGRLVTCQL